MIASFRRLSKSKIGTVILVAFGVAILASLALTDAQSFMGSGGGSGTLAKVGGQKLTERQLQDELARRLNMLRQQNPAATMADLTNSFDATVADLIDQMSLQEFARKTGFVVSKRLIDAEIANLPGTKGLDGRFSEQAYQQFLNQQRLTDGELRRLIGQEILQQLILQPVAASPRIPVGVAQNYASMLLELRQGEIGLVPVQAFAAGLKPTDADIQAHYAANRTSYMVPEQRVLRFARIGAAQVASVTATDQEISADYQKNRASYAPKSVRTLSQVVVQNQATANAIAAAAKASGSLEAAAKGKADAAFTNLGEQTREQLTSLGGAQVAGSVFSAAKGAIVGPVRSDFGWTVVKVEEVREQPGKSLEQAKAEIAPRLTEAKRKEALADLVSKIEDAIADGRNFQEAAAAAKVTIEQTPLITANGASRANPSFKLPPELAPAVQRGFELGESDDPEIVALNPEGTDNVLVGPAQVVAPAPAPLASIRDRVSADWVRKQAGDRAKAAATAIAAKVARGMPLAQAAAQAGVTLPAPRPVAVRRLQLAEMQGQVPASIQALFTLTTGKSRMVADPAGGGFAVVKLNGVTPGNAVLQPGLIAQVQKDFQEATSTDYARQFLTAVRKNIGVRRYDDAIADAKKRILAGS
ncbi:hypothetical protein G7077_13505 [Sphingomonas piscis]|uniref:Parvulin-like PPIase n=1 Tax=Sphingomonas piscis TaxID=2714943 RepID=A0A6G7YSR9_9SPHN|nr:peptidylprolyl isomerase [Sphingomonas piscis]QIK79771.1 hypothetical protein G7077_13505 [Sphingomonas piscis]